MLGLISDIHGNLEALQAVLAQIGDLQIYCLGDVICYGSDSVACIRTSAEWQTVVAGALDSGLIDQNPGGWSPRINQYLNSVRSQIEHVPDSESLNEIVKSYQSEFTENGVWFFHGAPGDQRDFIFPEELYCPSKLNKWVDHPQHAYIGGASHIPGIFRRRKTDWEFIVPENDVHYPLPLDEKTIITLGSVGQPRDEDPRAAYAILHDDSIVFHRVEYDMETTQRKIKDDPDNDDMNAERLPIGR